MHQSWKTIWISTDISMILSNTFDNLAYCPDLWFRATDDICNITKFMYIFVFKSIAFRIHFFQKRIRLLSRRIDISRPLSKRSKAHGLLWAPSTVAFCGQQLLQPLDKDQHDPLARPDSYRIMLSDSKGHFRRFYSNVYWLKSHFLLPPSLRVCRQHGPKWRLS